MGRDSRNDTVPAAGLLLPAASAAVAIVLALQSANQNLPRLLAICALTLAIPIVLGTLVELAAFGSTYFAFTSYGLSAVCFGALGLVPRLEDLERG